MTTTISFKHVDSPTVKPLHYTDCGLDNIYLAGGYQVRVIAGESYISVRDIDELHQAIAAYLVKNVKVLSGKEVRFLRKSLDLTQRELGDLLCVSSQSVARYEKDQSRLEGSTDNLLRLIVSAQVSECVNVREVLKLLQNADDSSGEVLTLERSDDEWRVAA